MKITYNLIKAEISGDFGGEVYGFDKGCGGFDSLMFYRPGIMPDSDICYVSDRLPEEDISCDGSVLLFICAPVDLPALEAAPFSTLCLPENTPAAEAVNMISAVLCKYNRWDDAMRQILHRNGTVNELLELSVPIFGNLLVVIDSVFRIAAISRPDELSEETVTGYGSEVSSAEMIKISSDFARMRTITTPMLRHLEGSSPTLCMNIYDGSFYLGVVCIVEMVRPLRDADVYLLEKFAASVRKAFLLRDTDRIDDKFTLGYVLSGLLGGSRYNENILSQVKNSAGIVTGDNFRVIAIRITNKTTGQYAEYFINKLGRSLPVIFISAEGEEAYALLVENWPDKEKNKMRKIFENELKESGIRAGMSERFSDLITLSLYAGQAAQASVIIETKPRNTRLLSFDECWLEYMLHACTGTERPITMQPEGFICLLKHDNENARVSYTETLRAYLFNNMNSQKAARSLYISRNSFLSRMERVEEILNMDLDDPLVRFRLMFSLLSLDTGKSFRKQ